MAPWQIPSLLRCLDDLKAAQAAAQAASIELAVYVGIVCAAVGIVLGLICAKRPK